MAVGVMTAIAAARFSSLTIGNTPELMVVRSASALNRCSARHSSSPKVPPGSSSGITRSTRVRDDRGQRRWTFQAEPCPGEAEPVVGHFESDDVAVLGRLCDQGVERDEFVEQCEGTACAPRHRDAGGSISMMASRAAA